MQHARLGGSGNEASARERSKKPGRKGLTPTIYCHAIGYHGHGAGPPIGMTDYQTGVPVRGDYVFRPGTWHSIELNVRHPGAGVGRPVSTVRARGGCGHVWKNGWHWIDGRQSELYRDPLRKVRHRMRSTKRRRAHPARAVRTAGDCFRDRL